MSEFSAFELPFLIAPKALEELAFIVASVVKDEQLTQRTIAQKLSPEGWDLVRRLPCGHDESPMSTFLEHAGEVGVITYDGISRRYGLGKLGTALINASLEKRI